MDQNIGFAWLDSFIVQTLLSAFPNVLFGLLDSFWLLVLALLSSWLSHWAWSLSKILFGWSKEIIFKFLILSWLILRLHFKIWLAWVIRSWIKWMKRFQISMLLKLTNQLYKSIHLRQLSCLHQSSHWDAVPLSSLALVEDEVHDRSFHSLRGIRNFHHLVHSFSDDWR